ncbi:PASTA domain-containing protein [Planomonospora algeriensis]
MLTGPAAGVAPPVAVPRQGRKRGSWVLLTVLALVMVAAVGVTGWLFSQDTTVVVPKLIEQNVKLAADQARHQGFAVEIGPAEHDEKVPKDVVLRTDPVAGTEVQPGAKLVLIASAGPKRVNVPNVVGLELNAAREKIAAAGLTVDDVKKLASETVPRGQVMKTSPAVGNQVKEGSKVDLYVSAGLLMPDVMGMHRDQARTTLESAGFVPEFVEQTDSAQPCTVIAQDPRAGAEVDRGAVARMTLSACNNGEWHWPWENNGENANDDNVIVIPNVVYKDVRAARDELSAAGFRVKVKKGLNRGRVLAQLPPGGQQVPHGTQVTLWH